MKLAEAFALNLRDWRQQREMSQGELADKIGSSLSYISLLERGKRTPSLEVIERAADALGVENIDLLIPAKARVPVVKAHLLTSAKEDHS